MKKTAGVGGRTDYAAIFNRNFNVVALINLFTMISYYLIFVISTPYAISRFHTTPNVAGLTAGIIVLGCLAGRFVTGNLISLLGCRKVLFSGLVVYIGSIGLYFTVDSLETLFAVRFLTGIGVGFIGTATGTIVAYVVPKHQHGIGISFFSMSTALALAFGPFLGITLLQWTDYEHLFMVSLGFGAANLLVFFGLTIADHLTDTPVQGTKALLRLSNYIDYRVLPFSLVVVVVCLCWGTVQAFISFYARERGLVGAASLFFLVYAATVLLTRPISGKIFDSRGENVIVYPTLLLTSLGMLALGVAESDWTMLCAGCLLGVGFGNFQSSAQAISLSLVPKDRFGQATSTFFIFFDMGLGFGPYIFGSLVPEVGYGGVYKIASGIAFASIALYYLMHGRKQRTEM